MSHVVRRLSMGVHPDLLESLDDADAAVASALDLGASPAPALEMEAPTDPRDRDRDAFVAAVAWWVERMRSGDRLIEERLVWFWHDHFATSLAKVRTPYLMHGQHLTIRRHASGSFAELLRAMAKDPAMLIYLDGVTNAAGRVNENFGRECLELFTMGIGGGYTQDDVVEASRSFSGWFVNVPGRRFTRDDLPLWSSAFVPRRHDAGEKTLLGRTGNFDLDDALDVVLDHPATARFVASKLYRELIGFGPDEETAERLAAGFRPDYAILPLVEAIVAEPAFLDDSAVRSKPRTPVEKLVGLVQAVPEATSDGIAPQAAGRVGLALRTVGYVPFVPPNVGGFPTGPSLLGPHQLLHSFDLLGALLQPSDDLFPDDVDELFGRLGLFDVSDRTLEVVSAEPEPARRFALAFTSPEFAVA